MREEEELSTRTDEILESLRANSTDIIATEQDKEMNVDYSSNDEKKIPVNFEFLNSSFRD